MAKLYLMTDLEGVGKVDVKLVVELERTLARQAGEALAPFGPRAGVLHGLAAALLQRNR